MSKIKKYLILALAIILLAVGLVSCGAREESAEAREICENYLDKVISNEPQRAYEAFKEICTYEDFLVVWDYSRNATAGATSYELKQTGWNFRKDSSGTATTTSFQALTDNEKLIQLTIKTNENGILSMNVIDSTEFEAETGYVPILTVVFIVIAIAFTVFTVWMLVDVCKRKLRKKFWWILLVLLCGWIEIASGAEYFNLDVGLGVLFSTWEAAKLYAANAIIIKTSFPVGAIIYFFLRKKISLKEIPDVKEAETEAVPAEEPADAADETVAQETQKEETDE